MAATWAFSSCGKWELLSSCGARASHRRGFSCCGAWALGVRASVVVANGLSCTWYVGSSQTRDRTRVPCIGGRILNHWTTREVPLVHSCYLVIVYYQMVGISGQKEK